MKKLMFILLLLSSTSFARSGGGGNGGGVHYCPENQERKVEFYDLYEGREVYELEINEKLMTMEEYLEQALIKINSSRPLLASRISANLKEMREKIKIVEGKTLSRVLDADTVMVDQGCRYEQLANWHELSGRIFVDPELYAELEKSALDMAAFFLHESAYKASRDSFGKQLVPNSNLVRKFVAQSLSEGEINTEITPEQFSYPGLSFQNLMGVTELIRDGEVKSYTPLDTFAVLGLQFTMPICRLSAVVNVTLKSTGKQQEVSLSAGTQDDGFKKTLSTVGDSYSFGLGSGNSIEIVGDDGYSSPVVELEVYCPESEESFRANIRLVKQKLGSRLFSTLSLLLIP